MNTDACMFYEWKPLQETCTLSNDILSYNFILLTFSQNCWELSSPMWHLDFVYVRCHHIIWSDNNFLLDNFHTLSSTMGTQCIIPRYQETRVLDIQNLILPQTSVMFYKRWQYAKSSHVESHFSEPVNFYKQTIFIWYRETTVMLANEYIAICHFGSKGLDDFKSAGAKTDIAFIN